MNKIIIAIAAAALMVGTAQADVVLYGTAHASMDYTNPDFTIAGDSGYDITNRASRLGFKGSEVISDGLSVIFKMEFGVDLVGSDDTDAFTKRNAYVGLKGTYGTVLIGRHDTPVKMSTARLDMFADTVADYNGALNDAGPVLGNNTGFTDMRVNNVAVYVSPTFGGFNVIAAVIPDGSYDNTGDFAGGYSVAGTWAAGNFYVGGGYENIDDLTGGLDSDRYRIGASYRFVDAFTVASVYEYETVGGVDANKVQVSASYDFGNNTVKGMYMKTDFDRNALDEIFDDGGSWAVGFDHNLSPRSKVYAIYADSDSGLNGGSAAFGAEDAFSVGIVHTF